MLPVRAGHHIVAGSQPGHLPFTSSAFQDLNQRHRPRPASSSKSPDLEHKDGEHEVARAGLESAAPASARVLPAILERRLLLCDGNGRRAAAARLGSSNRGSRPRWVSQVLSGLLLVLSGLAMAASMVGLALAMPVFLLFSPVLVPATLLNG